MKNPIEGVETVPMTLADGSRVYVRCRNNDDNNNNNKTTTSNAVNNASKSCSLGVSMKELLRRVNSTKRNDVATRRRIQAEESDPTSSSNTARGMVDDGDLWVDKHAPASFPHLLSDERTNREVLRALRAWDPYVFGRQQPSRPTSHVLYQQRMEQQQQQQQQRQPDPSNKGGNKNDKNNNNNPADKRPEEKSRVILLSGPPGVGK
jgi:chromosome transmission fidelity protein 18